MKVAGFVCRTPFVAVLQSSMNPIATFGSEYRLRTWQNLEEASAEMLQHCVKTLKSMIIIRLGKHVIPS
jgi:hypothetical protein